MDPEGGVYPHNPTMRAVSADRRRTILDVLRERDAPVPERGLAAVLEPPEGRTTATRDGATGVRAARFALRHVDLPVLDAAGLVRWHRDEETVATATHPALEDPRFHRLLGLETPGTDEALWALSHEHRRIVLTLLREAETSLTKADIAREIVRHDMELEERDPPPVDSVVTSVHHNHCPALADRDLVEHDPGSGRATYSGTPALEKVFDVVLDPDQQVGDGLDGFLAGLRDTVEESTREPGGLFEWPHGWREPYRG